jgi:LTXXQ motif family protein
MLDSKFSPRKFTARQIATRRIAIARIAIALGAAGLMLCAAAGTALAAKHGGGGGGGGGHRGGGGHSGGGAHVSAHVSGSHFSAARAHFTPRASSSRVTHFAKPSSTVKPLTTTAKPLTTTGKPLTTAARVAPLARAAFRADPSSFLAHRRFAGDPAFRPFLGHGWHPYHHLGWVGPVFWPYAYGDVFYCSLWPWSYCNYDPFWTYGYGDIYASIFSPYNYDQYVQGPGAPAQMATLTQSMANSCADEAAEVTGWPIDQIQAAVQPSPQQNALLDDLGNAVVKASDEIKSQCPTTVAFTPTDRLAQMQQRLQALVDAVNTVSPPLTKFYDSLSDEQKARFNDMSPPQQAQAPQGQQTPPSLASQCDATIMAWPSDQIDALVKPDDAQRAKLAALTSAASQAAGTIKAACPSEVPATPPSRLSAIGQHLQAMLQAVQAIQPPLADFYNSLSDDQKARFDSMGKQLFAANQE